MPFSTAVAYKGPLSYTYVFLSVCSVRGPSPAPSLRLRLPPTGPPRALPWLLLPTPGPNDGSTRAACCGLGGCSVHDHLTVDSRGARLFGSHDGAWLFLHLREQRSHQFLNVPTGRARELPTALVARTGPLANDMAILAAALLSSPDDAGCVAVAIVAEDQTFV